MCTSILIVHSESYEALERNQQTPSESYSASHSWLCSSHHCNSANITLKAALRCLCWCIPSLCGVCGQAFLAATTVLPTALHIPSRRLSTTPALAFLPFVQPFAFRASFAKGQHALACHNLHVLAIIVAPRRCRASPAPPARAAATPASSRFLGVLAASTSPVAAAAAAASSP